MSAANTRRFICLYCGFVYDEALGLPDHGIPAGTRWEDVPADFLCPDCANEKDAFVLMEA